MQQISKKQGKLVSSDKLIELLYNLIMAKSNYKQLIGSFEWNTKFGASIKSNIELILIYMSNNLSLLCQNQQIMSETVK